VHADRLADVAPERAHGHHQRCDRIEQCGAEQRRQYALCGISL